MQPNTNEEQGKPAIRGQVPAADVKFDVVKFMKRFMKTHENTLDKLAK